MENTNYDIIELAREIGRQLQKSEVYIKFRLAKQTADEDDNLQKLIGEFNLKRIAISNEVSRESKDEEKLKRYNQEMRSAYSQIMSNENMIRYNNAKADFDLILTRINAIIQKSSEGEDPDTADYTQSDCSGNCSACGGCG